MLLEQFRQDPDATITSADFFVDVDHMPGTSLGATGRHLEGGPCSVTEEGMESGVCRLKIAAGGRDYHFPWVNRGVGEVTVPRDAPDGTLVVTGGMNGCGLVVQATGADLIFYHDADNSSLGQVTDPRGTPVCHVEPRVYMPTSLGASLASGASDGRGWLHQLIIVRHEQRWKVYNCGIVFGPGRAVGKRLYLPVIRSFNDGIVKRVTSFT